MSECENTIIFEMEKWLHWRIQVSNLFIHSSEHITVYHDFHRGQYMTIHVGFGYDKKEHGKQDRMPILLPQSQSGNFGGQLGGLRLHLGLCVPSSCTDGEITVALNEMQNG